MSKLTQRKFLEMIGVFKSAYSNFNFNEVEKGKPSSQVIVWYEALNIYSYDDLYKATIAYIRNNVYPPSSPAAIINELKKLKKATLEPAESVYNRFIDVWRQEKYIMSKTKKRLETEHSVAKQAFDMIAPMLEEREVSRENINTWLKKEFVSIYNGLLEREFYKESVLNDKKLIGGNDE